MKTITRRRAALMISAAALFGLSLSAARAQGTHTGGRGGGRGGGHTPGGGGDEHSHDESEHTETDHEHEEHDPDAGSDHADGKRGPRYQGGRASTEVLGRGYGRSLEERVLRAD